MREPSRPRLALDGFAEASEGRLRTLIAQLPVLGIPPDLLTLVDAHPFAAARDAAAAFYLPNLLSYAMVQESLRRGALRLGPDGVELGEALAPSALDEGSAGEHPIAGLWRRYREPRVDSSALALTTDAALVRLTEATPGVRWLRLTEADALAPRYARGHLIAPSDCLVVSLNAEHGGELLSLVPGNLRQHGVLYLGLERQVADAWPRDALLERIGADAWVTDVVEHEAELWIRAVRYIELAAHRRFLSYYL